MPYTGTSSYEIIGSDLIWTNENDINVVIDTLNADGSETFLPEQINLIALSDGNMAAVWALDILNEVDNTLDNAHSSVSLNILENNNIEYDFSSYNFNEVDGSDNLTFTFFKTSDNATTYSDIVLESPLNFQELKFFVTENYQFLTMELPDHHLIPLLLLKTSLEMFSFSREG